MRCLATVQDQSPLLLAFLLLASGFSGWSWLGRGALWNTSRERNTTVHVAKVGGAHGVLQPHKKFFFCHVAIKIRKWNTVRSTGCPLRRSPSWSCGTLADSWRVHMKCGLVCIGWAFQSLQIPHSALLEFRSIINIDLDDRNWAYLQATTPEERDGIETSKHSVHQCLLSRTT